MSQETQFPTADNLESIGSPDRLTVKEKKAVNKKTLAAIAGILSVGAIALGGIGYFTYSNLSGSTDKFSSASIAKPIENSNPELVFNQPTGLPPGMPPVNVVAEPQPPQPIQNNEQPDAEDQLRNNRYKSSLVVQGSGGTSVISEGSDPSAIKQVPPELQGIFGAMGMGGGASSGQNQPPSVSSQGGRFGGGSDMAPSANARYIDNREYKILQGKIIHATMLTAVKSDIPGQIIAQVSEPVYGDQGRYQLLPAGTRLFGEYSSMVRYGQAEIAAVWRRAITPQGVEVMLDSPSANGLGIAGIGGGRVNNHFFQTFGTAALLSLIGVGAEVVGAKTSDENNSIANVRNAVYQSFQETAGNTLKDRTSIPPTITVPHGQNIVVIVAKELDFSRLFSD